jgi:hypothetical protein
MTIDKSMNVLIVDIPGGKVVLPAMPFVSSCKL